MYHTLAALPDSQTLPFLGALPEKKSSGIALRKIRESLWTFQRNAMHQASNMVKNYLNYHMHYQQLIRWVIFS